MSKNLLPAGLVPPSKTSAYDALIGKSLEQEQPILDARNALLKAGVDAHKGIVSQAHIRDMDLIDTGSPIENERLRLEKDRNRGMNLYDDKVIRDAMKGLKTQDATDYTSNLNLEKAMRGEEHRVWDENTMRTLNRSDPNYIKNLGDAVEHSAQYGINAPAVTAEATQAFANTATQFRLNRNPDGELSTGDLAGDTVTNAIKATGGKLSDAKAYNSNAYRAAEKVAVKNMAEKNRHIRDHSVFKTRFKEMIENHPVYGQKFKLGIADEAGMTLDTQTLEKFTTKISEGVNDRDPLTGEQTKAGRKTVVDNLNNLLSYMNINNIKDAKFDDLVIRTLERDPLTATEIFKEAGVAEPEKEAVINTNFQAKAKKYVREYYRGTHPELTDSILTKAYDRIINSGSDNISVAVGIGKRNAERRTELREFQAKSKFEVYKTQLTNLNDIRKRGLVPHVTDNLFQQFKTKFPEAEMRPEDDERLKNQVGGVLDRLKTHIGKGLQGDEKNAFNLTARRMIMEHATWDQHTKWFGFRWPSWAGFAADFDVLKKGGKMNKQNKLAIIELFHNSIVDPDIIAKATGSDPKIKQGAEMLEKKLRSKITTLGGAVQARKKFLKDNAPLAKSKSLNVPWPTVD